MPLFIISLITSSTKPKSIFEEYKDNSKLLNQEEWELNEIKRDGTSEQKNTHTYERCPYVAEK